MDKEEDSLLGRAVVDYNIAVTVFQKFGKNADERYLNQIGYHLQQAVELCLKDQLMHAGVEYPKTHDIDQLIRIGNEHHANLLVTDYIDEHSDMLSNWEAKTRYILGYFVEYRKIEKAVVGVKEFLSEVIKQRRQEKQKSSEQTYDHNQQAKDTDDEMTLG